MPALAARGDGSRAHFVSELDDRDEAVAAGAIPFLGLRIRPCAERGQRTPGRRSEFHGNARLRIVERLNDIAIETLEPVDLAPWRAPCAKLFLQPVTSSRQ